MSGRGLFAGGSARAAFAAALLSVTSSVSGGHPSADWVGPGSPEPREASIAPLPSPTVALAPGAGVPVTFGGTTLFRVSQRLGPFSASERASAVAERIRKLATEPSSDDLRLTVADGETTTELVLGERVIATVSDADASAAGVGRRALAESHARAIEAAVGAARREVRPRRLLLDTLYALLATAVLAALLLGLRKAGPAVTSRLEEWRKTRVAAIRFQKLELVSAARVTDALIFLVGLLRVAVSLTAVLLYVPLLLSFFPWTRGLVAPLLGYAAAPIASLGAALVAYVPKLFFLVVIGVLTRYSLRLVRLFFKGIGSGSIAFAGFEREWAAPTYGIVRFLVIAFAVVVAFPYLPGSQSEAFKGVSLFLGVLFSLSSSSAISNIVAGVILTYTRAFRLGDRVKIADTVGDVVEKSLLVTRLRTIKNVDVTIPNAMVLASHVVNFSSSARAHGLILHTSVTIGYDAPWRDVHAALIAAARATPRVLEDPAPFVLQTSLDDFYVRYEINAYTDEPGSMAVTYSDLHANIQDRFNEAGLEIMSPHYATLRDGNQVTIPETYLPKTYEAPPFRILPLDHAASRKPPSGGA